MKNGVNIGEQMRNWIYLTSIIHSELYIPAESTDCLFLELAFPNTETFDDQKTVKEIEIYY